MKTATTTTTTTAMTSKRHHLALPILNSREESREKSQVAEVVAFSKFRNGIIILLYDAPRSQRRLMRIKEAQRTFREMHFYLLTDTSRFHPDFRSVSAHT